MWTAILGVLAFAALFAAFGLLQPERRSCGGNCGSCGSGCERDVAP